MEACVQSTTKFGAELWWKGDIATGTQGWAEEIQQLITRKPGQQQTIFRWST